MASAIGPSSPESGGGEFRLVPSFSPASTRRTNLIRPRATTGERLPVSSTDVRVTLGLATRSRLPVSSTDHRSISGSGEAAGISLCRPSHPVFQGAGLSLSGPTPPHWVFGCARSNREHRINREHLSADLSCLSFFCSHFGPLLECLNFLFFVILFFLLLLSR